MLSYIGPLPAGVNFNGLSFLPAGVLEAGTETLVGATYEGHYYYINRWSGAASYYGTYAGGFGSSGDIVFTVHSAAYSPARVVV